jgi:hypothetical protein
MLGHKDAKTLGPRPHQDLKENAMSDALITALLGRDPAALAEDVSLATPLTLPRITGRNAVAAALGAYADVMGATDADLRLKGKELDGAVFTTSVDGHTAQVVALVTQDARGLIATVDMYGQPWPYTALIRDRVAKVDPNLANPDLGTSPYVPEGPGTSWTDDPAIPPFAEDVTLFSPFFTARLEQVCYPACPVWGSAVLQRAEVPRCAPGRGPAGVRSGPGRNRGGPRAAGGRNLHAQRRPDRGQGDPDLQPSVAGDRLLPQLVIERSLIEA